MNLRAEVVMDKKKEKRKTKKQQINKSEEVRQSDTQMKKSEPESKKADKINENKSELISKKNIYETIIIPIIRSLHQSLNLQEVLENAAEAIYENIDVVDHLAFFLIDGDEAVLQSQRGHPEWFIKRVKRIPYPNGLTWKTIIEGKTIYCDDVDKDTAISLPARKVGIKSYLSLPINYHGKTIGAINIHSNKKFAFDEHDIRLLKLVAQQVEIAVKNAQQAKELKDLYEELRARNKDLEILNTINLAVHKFFDVDQVYDTALDMTDVMDNVDMTMIYLVDEQRKEAILQGHRNVPEDYVKRASRIPFQKGVTWEVINSRKILNIEDAQNHPNIGPAGRKLGHHGILGVPISIEDETIGVIWFCSYKERKFDEQEVELLSSIGYQIATAIAKANLYKELIIKNRYESTISSVVRSVHQSIELQDVMENAIDSLRENIEAIEHIGIYLVEGEEAVLRAYRGLPEWFYNKIKRIPYPKGYIWNTRIEGKSRYVADVDEDKVIGPSGKKFGTKSYLCVPICNDGRTIGVLGIASLKKNAFDKVELTLLEIVAHQIKNAINNARQAEELKNTYRELSNRNKDLEILNAINLTVHKFHDLDQIFKTALDMTEIIENVDVASIYLVDEQRSVAILRGQCNLPEDYIKRASRIPYPKGATWKTIISGEIINIEDAQNHPDIGPAGNKLGHHGVLGVPIKFEDEPIGVIWFGSYKKRKFDAQEVELLSSIGFQIATAIAKANLYTELMIKNRYEKIVSSILRSIYQSIDLQEVLENAVEALIKNIERLDAAAIYLVEGKEVVLKSHRGYSKKYIKAAGRIPYPRGATWKAIKYGKLRYVPDVKKDKYLGPAGRELGMKSYLSAPILSYGKAVGTLNLVSFQKDAFDKEDLKLLETVAEEIEIAINNARQAHALRESEDRFRTIADTAPVVIWLSGPDNVKNYFNKVYLEFTGRTLEQEVGEGWLDGVHPDDLEYCRNTYLPAFKAQKEFKMEYRHKRFDREYRWILVHGVPRFHADGSFAGFIGSCFDITDHKKIEEELEDKKSRLITTFNSMTNAVIATDVKGSITFMNLIAEKLIGLESEDAIGLNLGSVLKIKNIETNKLIKIPRGKLLKEDAFVNKSIHTNLVMMDGKEIPIDIDTSYIREEKGEVCGIVLALHENTELDLVKRNIQANEQSKITIKNINTTPIKLMTSVSSVFVEEGISKILDSESDINISARTTEHTEVIPLIQKIKPDVLLFDTAQAKPDIQEIMKSIKEKQAKTKVLLLLHEPDERFIIDVISLGVRGCLTQASNRDQLVQAIKTVHNNEIWMDVGIVTKILTRMLPKVNPDIELDTTNLTKKETEIVKLVIQGLSNKQISKQLYITEVTVKTHLGNVFKKVGVTSRFQLLNKFRYLDN